ncbi:MAG: ABC transporter permease subunit [Gemmatimonadota bacterium]
MRRPSVRSVAASARGTVAGAIVAGVVLVWLGATAMTALEQRGVPLGFGFLGQQAGFDIGDAPIRYAPEDTFARALLVGLVNTARISAAGWVLCIGLGFALGLIRLSTNPSLRGASRAFVELARNTPLLLLLLLLMATLHALPAARDSIGFLPGFFLSDRGLAGPIPRFDGGWVWDVPRLEGFNFSGGFALSPEFTALLLALTIHHAAHVSEVVRGAVLAVGRGQHDAAWALGLSRWRAMRRVILPQALRAMVPLLASNCVSLTKNSSLAVAIGFADAVSILNTTANQTGHAIEAMLLMIVMYLSLSLIVAASMNWYNARVLKVLR